MSAPPAEVISRPANPLLRRIVIVVAVAETVFWVYTIYYIITHADPMGDGMEIVAIGPMSIIFFVLTLPALILGLTRRAAVVLVAGGFAIASFAANFWIWSEILSEFAS